jgi:hypothetical protein
MDSQDIFNNPSEQWNQQTFNPASSWPQAGSNDGTSAQAFRPGLDTFETFEQQASVVVVPTIPLFSPNPPSQMVYTSLPSAVPSSSSMSLQSDFPSLKAPNFANILQYHTASGSQLNPEPQDRPSQTRRPRTRIHHRINPKDWEKYKAHIKKLYIEKGKTVSEIMVDMSSHFKFSAS